MDNLNIVWFDACRRANKDRRVLCICGPHTSLKRALFEHATGRSAASSLPVPASGDACMSGCSIECKESDALLGGGGTTVLCGEEAAAGTPLLLKHEVAAAMTSQVLLHCTSQLPPRDQLLSLLRDIVAVAQTVSPKLQTESSGGFPVKSSATSSVVPCHLVLVVGDTLANVPTDEASRIERWLLRIEPTYSDLGQLRKDAAHRNEMRLSIVDAFASIKVVLAPSADEFHFDDKLRQLLGGQYIKGKLLGSMANTTSIEEPEVLVQRVAALRLSSPDESWGTQCRDWMLERVKGIVKEDFDHHLNVRRARLTKELVDTQKEQVVRRCEQMLTSAVGDDEDVKSGAMVEVQEQLDGSYAKYITIAEENEKSSTNNATALNIRGGTGARGSGGQQARSAADYVLSPELMERIPHQYKFWFTKHGVLVIGVVLLFVLGTYFSSTSGGGGKPKAAK